jgi:hypothetical protein
LSQPPFQSAPYAPAGPYAPVGPYAPPAPAAPTQVAFPGQVQLPPQPQFAPSPQQVAATRQGPLASGFPRYVSPPPSPVNRTGLYVGIVVVVLTILFAVIGFALVA